MINICRRRLRLWRRWSQSDNDEEIIQCREKLNDVQKMKKFKMMMMMMKVKMEMEMMSPTKMIEPRTCLDSEQHWRRCRTLWGPHSAHTDTRRTLSPQGGGAYWQSPTVRLCSRWTDADPLRLAQTCGWSDCLQGWSFWSSSGDNCAPAVKPRHTPPGGGAPSPALRARSPETRSEQKRH
jgi:hypothetical protein